MCLCRYAPWYAVLVLLTVNALVWSDVAGEERSGVARVAFLDVGQGDAIYIEAENGNRMLIDSGATATVLRELGRFMRPGERTLDVVVATHPDLDHIGGLPDVFERYDVGLFLEPGVKDEGDDYRALVDAVREEGLQPVEARAGQVLALDEGVYLEILFPDRDVSALEANSGSIVGRLVCGNDSFLLTGDSPEAIEEYLVGARASLKSDVLKLGHHGSRTSSSDSFLDAVAPTTAIVSAGCDNRYGHPHSEVLERLAARGVAVCSTCAEGTVMVTCGE